MREIKFRAWFVYGKNMVYDLELIYQRYVDNIGGFKWMQFTGLKDKNGKEIYEGDILQFSNRREWFRLDLFLKNKEEQNEILNNLKEYPFERRIIEMPNSYEWMLDDEIQRYWEVIGNIYENKELLE